MDLIFDELRANGINLDKDTLSRHKNSVLEEQSYVYSHVETYNSLLELNIIYDQIKPINYGRIIVYLALVCKLSRVFDDETLRQAVRRAVSDLKRLDLSKYKPKKYSLLWCWLGRLFLWTTFAYIELQN